ncbi:hypothetical protein ACFL50_03950 [Candidatus Latescibacterota bacterium]
MEIVLDTVSVFHLLSQSKKSKERGSNKIETILDNFLEKFNLVIVFDFGHGLSDEWGQTCGREIVKVLLIHWESFNAIKMVEPVAKINPTISKELRQLGFYDTIDKLVLRIALATSDKIVVSEDSHFWDPRNPKIRGDKRCPVTKLCLDKLEITILLLKQLIPFCRQNK